jgi:ABC-type protease/lipase transport system fused ATPase/permease subunit
MTALKRSLLSQIDFARLLWSRPGMMMLFLLVIEAALSAGTTYLLIRTGRNVANDEFQVMDLIWILIVQSTAYAVGAVSWVFGEQAGFGAYGRYMHRFAQTNRGRSLLLSDTGAREVVEPFLTGETFHIFFELVYELESVLRLLLAVIFNAIVLGVEIDGWLSVSYFVIIAICLSLQYALRKPVAKAYLSNQKRTNLLTAHSYTAWDNIFTGNRYNYSVWNRVFKVRLRVALKAQIRAILAREGLSSIGGIISLAVVFAVTGWVAWNSRGASATMIALAATLPRQIELAHSVQQLAEGWNDLVALWTRIGGAVENFAPIDPANFEARTKLQDIRLHCSEMGELRPTDLQQALAGVRAHSQGRVLIRGPNGSGKSSLLALIKDGLGPRAYYWPTTDRLAFSFSKRQGEGGGEAGFSAGQRQIATLQEIVNKTSASYYLLDEWDANLDADNRAIAEALVEELAQRARVVEVSHRDPEAVKHHV